MNVSVGITTVEKSNHPTPPCGRIRWTLQSKCDNCLDSKISGCSGNGIGACRQCTRTSAGNSCTTYGIRGDCALIPEEDFEIAPGCKSLLSSPFPHIRSYSAYAKWDRKHARTLAVAVVFYAGPDEEYKTMLGSKKIWWVAMPRPHEQHEWFLRIREDRKSYRTIRKGVKVLHTPTRARKSAFSSTPTPTPTRSSTATVTTTAATGSTAATTSPRKRKHDNNGGAGATRPPQDPQAVRDAPRCRYRRPRSARPRGLSAPAVPPACAFRRGCLGRAQRHESYAHLSRQDWYTSTWWQESEHETSSVADQAKAMNPAHTLVCFKPGCLTPPCAGADHAPNRILSGKTKNVTVTGTMAVPCPRSYSGTEYPAFLVVSVLDRLRQLLGAHEVGATGVVHVSTLDSLSHWIHDNVDPLFVRYGVISSPLKVLYSTSADVRTFEHLVANSKSHQGT
ncbi:uncharacterized protein BXZ73DRAFT_82915 [Epithele typhae]|uniref:uncharacterized protein n=1 Tax=Epithele typhae TaxID=378194 RepID=UPI002008614D|nr:uncharacterized protein BXZ73DRAFT_82915 [Epithele typhae]KAH9911232.1 hypothetical protein BXZ73DRAFT_82915 [Epithele typhae]